jgi:hypothetical protein
VCAATSVVILPRRVLSTLSMVFDSIRTSFRGLSVEPYC